MLRIDDVLSDATKAIRNPQRRAHCDEDNAQPTAAYTPQSHEMLQIDDVLSDATKAMRNPQRRARCDETNAQPTAAYAQQSHDECNTQPTAACALRRRRQCAANSGARSAEPRTAANRRCSFGCDNGKKWLVN